MINPIQTLFLIGFFALSVIGCASKPMLICATNVTPYSSGSEKESLRFVVLLSNLSEETIFLDNPEYAQGRDTLSFLVKTSTETRVVKNEREYYRNPSGSPLVLVPGERVVFPICLPSEEWVGLLCAPYDKIQARVFYKKDLTSASSDVLTSSWYEAGSLFWGLPTQTKLQSANQSPLSLHEETDVELVIPGNL